MSGKHGQRGRFLATAFSVALQRHQQLRVSWLSVLRAQTERSGPVVPIAPEDAPPLEKLERRLPANPSIRLDAFIARLSVHAPEVFGSVARPLLDLWLMSAVVRYQGRKYPDPLKPWEPRGRRKGSHGHPPLEDIVRAVLDISRQEYPSKEKLMRKLGRGGDPRRVNEWLEPHGMIYTGLLRIVLPPS